MKIFTIWNKNIVPLAHLVILMFCLSLLSLNALRAQTLCFDGFTSLPSEQGWNYYSNTSDTLFLINESILQQNSIGKVNAMGYFTLDRGSVVNSIENWSLETRVRVVDMEKPNSGFFFNVVQNEMFYSIRLTPSEVWAPYGNEFQFQIYENDNTEFNDFKIIGGLNSEFVLFINDIEIAQLYPIPFDSLNFTPGYDLAFGDGSARDSVNTSGEWASFVFSQNYIHPRILSIEDVPNDQGGWVRVYFNKSEFDSDSLVLTKSALTEMYTLEINDGTGWTAAASTVAYGKMTYSVLVPTTEDSTSSSDGHISFRVIAGMQEGNFASPEATGYSVDNLAPSVPLGLSATLTSDSKVSLLWATNMEKDFNHYRVFRNTNNLGFELIAETIEAKVIDADVETNSDYSYAIEAVDYSGNKSALSENVNVTVTRVESVNTLPEKYSLKQNYPNPFNPTTIIEYSILEPGNVTINIYNLLGEIVQVLENSTKTPGNHQVKWDAKNSLGQSVGAGVYFYEISMKEFSAIKKMIFIK